MTFFDMPSVRDLRSSPTPPQPTPTRLPVPAGQTPEHDANAGWDNDEWEDERAVTPIEDSVQLITNDASSCPKKQSKRSLSNRMHLPSSHSVYRPKRLKSRGRQKAQNARAGIKVVTDFTAFRKPTTSQKQAHGSPGSVRRPKFVDLAALRALEGSPTSASTGNWNWLRRQKSGASPNHLVPSPADSGLSPADRPIVIGISMDEGVLAGRKFSPDTPVARNPAGGLPPIHTAMASPTSTARSVTPATPSQLRSVWSPDTPGSATTIDLESRRGVSSIYTQMTGVSAAGGAKGGMPPVPEVPPCFKRRTAKPVGGGAVGEDEDGDVDDTGTPHTLFEEDAPTPTKYQVGRRRSAAHAAHGHSVISDTIPEWWGEDSNVQPSAVSSARLQRDELESTRAPVDYPATSTPRQHQGDVTNISVTAAAAAFTTHAQREPASAGVPPLRIEGKGLAGILGAGAMTGEPTPPLQSEPARKPVEIQYGHSENSRRQSHSRPVRTQSTISEVVTEFWDDESSTPTATTTAVIPPPCPQRELTRRPIAVQETRSEELKQQVPVRAGRTQSTVSDAITEIWDGEPSVQVPATTRAVPQDHRQQRGPAGGVVAIHVDWEESEPSLRTSPAPGLQFPPRSNSLAPVQWASRTPSPSRALSRRQTPPPPREQSPRRAASPAWSQSPRRNQSPGRTAGARVALGGLALGAATMSSAGRASPTPVGNSRAGSAVVAAEEDENPAAGPPPYSSPRQVQAPARFRPVLLPDTPSQGRLAPSPGSISPAMAQTMTSQGAANMTEIPLTPGPAPTTFQNRTAGGFVPAERYAPVESRQDRVERKRQEEEMKRQEKERKREENGGGGAGGILKWGWRLRSLFSRNQPAAAATVPEGPKKSKPIWPWVTAGAVAALIIVAAILATTLTRGGGGGGDGDTKPSPDDSIWVNVPGFPPMPTGVLTVVGPDNSRAVDRCTSLQNVWSCDLPRELQKSVAPYGSNQPTVVMQIQFDNTTQASWNIPNGKPPVPKPLEDVEDSDDDGSRSSRLRRSATLGRRLRKRLAPGIFPDPSPPSFEEMYFLGNTTDGVVSEDKAGEPTPFYISLIPSVDEPAGPDLIKKRSSSSSSSSSVAARQFSDNLPEPELDSDGMVAPARLLPFVRQQPIRLYDKGLPTEHYGFYTYFSRTLFLRSVAPNTTEEIARDQRGGAPRDEANVVVTWSETRFLVRLWTGGDKELLSGGDKVRGMAGSGEERAKPGTMPYPVTMSLDTHGGDPAKKFVWTWGLDKAGKVDVEDVKFLANDIGDGGELVNPRPERNRSFGGFDGGVGGCGCEWVNFVR